MKNQPCFTDPALLRGTEVRATRTSAPISRRVLIRAAVVSLSALYIPACQPAPHTDSPIRSSAAEVAPTTAHLPPATIILVRHAHRATDPANPKDPPLSDEGFAQAQLLEWATRDAGLDRILISDMKRTRQTAGPTAAAAPTTLVLREGGDYRHDAEPAEVARVILNAATPGTTTLVVSHSHHIPALLKCLGNWDFPDYRTFTEADSYRFLFIITVNPDGTKSLIRAGYPPLGPSQATREP